MSTASSGQQMTLPVWVGALMIGFGHFAWLTPWQLRVKFAVRHTNHKKSETMARIL